MSKLPNKVPNKISPSTTNIERDDIYIIGRHSNWSENGVDKFLKERVYNNAVSWGKFLRLLFISLGVTFSTAGIIFFFAYNWQELHKFAKIGLIEGLIVITTLIVLFSKLKLGIKNIVLTGISVLVGVLFAVFGQIYQTGANAYDFFLGWTMFITLWVLVANFAPLWLVYITLINTTVVLYAEQVAHNWSGSFIFLLLFVINTSFLLLGLWGSNVRPGTHFPRWFSNVLALAAVSITTIGITVGIFDDQGTFFWILFLVTAIAFTLGMRYGLTHKRIFYLAVIPFSLIVMVSAFLINVTDDPGMFLVVCLFLIASVTAVIKSLINIQKKWANE
ncbi:DUF2157 domain-containing protein [Spongiimicrobium sp. 3-5]|uniref:DUF2157 domain-containing protein n=1 Tax=Spongiimicrobium sp. 3-5 TaxID=3332596 RepID=UPI00397F63A2